MMQEIEVKAGVVGEGVNSNSYEAIKTTSLVLDYAVRLIGRRVES